MAAGRENRWEDWASPQYEAHEVDRVMRESREQHDLQERQRDRAQRELRELEQQQRDREQIEKDNLERYQRDRAQREKDDFQRDMQVLYEIDREGIEDANELAEMDRYYNR
jgi:biopolymer transport protein ExbB/TolQ